MSETVTKILDPTCAVGVERLQKKGESMRAARLNRGYGQCILAISCLHRNTYGVMGYGVVISRVLITLVCVHVPC